MQHDSYFCKRYSGTRAFPTRRKNETNNFVATVVAENMYIWEKCPEKCRPREHPDWEYCQLCENGNFTKSDLLQVKYPQPIPPCHSPINF